MNRGPERGSRNPTVSSVTEHVRSPFRLQAVHKAGQVLEIATIWSSFSCVPRPRGKKGEPWWKPWAMGKLLAS